METAQTLLSDFRAVEHNFRLLDRDARIKISTWEGTKGDLLDHILGDRDAIAESDQGRSFRAFYDLLMSTDRQDELTRLLERMLALDPIKILKPNKRIKRVHYDWLTAAEATQRTAAKLSGELRRYLDDKAWLENRRIMRILHDIEARAIEISDTRPTGDFIELDATAPEIALPMDRPLISRPHRPTLDHRATATCSDDASVEAAGEHRKMLKSLREEGLPRFEARFKSLLNENAIREVAGFQSRLREEERTIRDRIETINGSLRDIDYHDGTYIEVEAAATLDAEIKEFQQDLTKCTENALTGSEDNGYAEAKFLQVKRVIERSRGRDKLTDLDMTWTRKVTDVRNWFEFSASERWR